jgi:hypothetical protein
MRRRAIKSCCTKALHFTAKDKKVSNTPKVNLKQYMWYMMLVISFT